MTNEEADGVCEVQGPSSFYRSVVCDNAWSEDYLPEGDFILNVTVYDRSLNMAGPFQHKWYNRKYPIRPFFYLFKSFFSRRHFGFFNFIVKEM